MSCLCRLIYVLTMENRGSASLSPEGETSSPIYSFDNFQGYDNFVEYYSSSFCLNMLLTCSWGWFSSVTNPLGLLDSRLKSSMNWFWISIFKVEILNNKNTISKSKLDSDNVLEDSMIFVLYWYIVFYYNQLCWKCYILCGFVVWFDYEQWKICCIRSYGRHVRVH